jgi:4-carboxymuconolactone decarboxylase
MSESKRQKADRLIEEVFGAGYHQRKTGLAKQLYDIIEEPLFGDVYQRPGLELRERSIVTIAILTALGRENQLRNHVRAGLKLGLTRQAITEVLIQAAFYAGVPAGLNALRAADAVFAELDKEQA